MWMNLLSPPPEAAQIVGQEDVEISVVVHVDRCDASVSTGADRPGHGGPKVPSPRFIRVWKSYGGEVGAVAQRRSGGRPR